MPGNTRIRIAQDANAFEFTITEVGEDALAGYFGTWSFDAGLENSGRIQSENPEYNFWAIEGNVISVGANWPYEDHDAKPGERLITSHLFLFNALRKTEGSYAAVGEVGEGRLLANGTLRFDLTRMVKWQARFKIDHSAALDGEWKI